MSAWLHIMLNRITTAPPMNRGAPCTMVNNVTGAQVCDARDDASSTAAGNKIII